MPIFGLCLLGNPKYVSCIGTLLKANLRSFAIYFGFRWGLLVGDGVRSSARETMAPFVSAMLNRAPR